MAMSGNQQEHECVRDGSQHRTKRMDSKFNDQDLYAVPRKAHPMRYRTPTTYADTV